MEQPPILDGDCDGEGVQAKMDAVRAMAGNWKAYMAVASKLPAPGSDSSAGLSTTGSGTPCSTLSGQTPLTNSGVNSPAYYRRTPVSSTARPFVPSGRSEQAASNSNQRPQPAPLLFAPMLVLSPNPGLSHGWISTPLRNSSQLQVAAQLARDAVHAHQGQPEACYYSEVAQEEIYLQEPAPSRCNKANQRALPPAPEGVPPRPPHPTEDLQAQRNYNEKLQEHLYLCFAQKDEPCTQDLYDERLQEELYMYARTPSTYASQSRSQSPSPERGFYAGALPIFAMAAHIAPCSLFASRLPEDPGQFSCSDIELNTMATLEHNDSEELDSNVPVKNTFIHYGDDLRNGRRPSRSSSAPCKMARARCSLAFMSSSGERSESQKQDQCVGDCHPCAYFFRKADGCRQGDDCKFCHMCPPDAMKRYKKDKKEKLKALKLALKGTAHAVESMQ